MHPEIQRRRTFAIIAHPDAGKTTLTEKLLLYGGAIQLAGQVRAKRDRRGTKSDWMKLEQDRGISINTSAMQFLYQDHILNLLDTPGHEDFSEDTYRTLMAVESAIMLLDGARGVEEQTIKLFRICQERKIPIITLVNKMDRPARDPFELMDEIEEILGITCSPRVWPFGSGPDFKGIYDFEKKLVYQFEKTAGGAFPAPVEVAGLEDPGIREMLGEDRYEDFLEEVGMAQEILPDMDQEKFLTGEITPVYFGSAVTNFGIQLLLDNFLGMAPPPHDIPLDTGGTLPVDQEDFTAFIFKLQANMNKAHRDRVAFARITSGKFTRGMQVNVPRLGKAVKLASPVSFFGQERSTIDEAWPGDIIGLINPRLYQIGDILCEGEPPPYRPLPRFAPEAFARIIPTDTSKLKSFKKGLMELGEEGVVQVFNPEDNTPIIGGVGQLQFEVFKFRMEDEYKAACRIEMTPYHCSRWIRPEQVDKLPDFARRVTDLERNTVVIFESAYGLEHFRSNYEDIELLEHPP